MGWLALRMMGDCVRRRTPALRCEISPKGIFLLPILLLALLFFSSAAGAQTQVTLGAIASPSSGQAGVSSSSVTGSGFPSGTISPGNVTLTPSGGGASVNTQASSITTLVGSTRRVLFTIPASINVLAPTNFLVSISGTTSTGGSFSSLNSSTITINPPASVALSPATGQVGQTVSVSITGNFTNFVQGATQANFGTGIAVGGGTFGLFGPVTVTSATSAVATVAIASNAPAGPRSITVATGAQQATATLNVTAAVLQSIAITPASTSVTAAKTVQFTATGTYSDNSTQNLTNSVIWTSSSTAVAT